MHTQPNWETICILMLQSTNWYSSWHINRFSDHVFILPARILFWNGHSTKTPNKNKHQTVVFFSPLAAASWCSDLNNFSQFSTDCANCCQVALQFKNQKLVFSLVLLNIWKLREYLAKTHILCLFGENMWNLTSLYHVKTLLTLCIRFDSLVTKSKNMSLETVAVWCHSIWNNESSQTQGQNTPMTLDPPLMMGGTNLEPCKSYTQVQYVKAMQPLGQTCFWF